MSVWCRSTPAEPVDDSSIDGRAAAAVESREARPSRPAQFAQVLLGLLTVFYGLLVMSLRPAALPKVTVFAGVAFVIGGITPTRSARAVDRSWRWLAYLGGLIGIGAGVAAFGRPARRLPARLRRARPRIHRRSRISDAAAAQHALHPRHHVRLDHLVGRPRAGVGLDTLEGGEVRDARRQRRWAGRDERALLPPGDHADGGVAVRERRGGACDRRRDAEAARGHAPRHGPHSVRRIPPTRSRCGRATRTRSRSPRRRSPSSTSWPSR